MSDFVTHEAVETVDGTVERVGGTRRQQVVVPALDAPDDDVVRVVLDGSEYRAPVTTTTSGDVAFQGAYESPSAARDRRGTDELANWLGDHGLDTGRTVHVDVVDPGFRYGLRAPGQTATYRETSTPSDSLADIARNLDG